MAKQPTRSAGKWRNTVIAVVALIAGLTASAAQAALTPVYRFYHLDAGRHFYTANEAEKAKVLTAYPRFAYEGVAFYAHSTQAPATVPVYRFYHQLNGSHVYTASESEKTTILTNYPVYAYEGIAYYAQAGSGGESVALYRLYNTKLGTHFFTTSQSEANNAVAAWPWFVLEGAIYYVQSTGGATANQSPTVSLVASATSGKIGDVVKLTATANDSDGSISKVEFYKDADKIGETTSAPHLLSYTLPAAGTFTFSAIATDNGGMVAASNPIVASVTGSGGGGGGGGGANVAPTIFITAVTTSLVPGAATEIAASVSDNDGSVARVDFYDGATLLASDGYAPFTYNFSTNTNGTHPITAIAFDNLGAQTTSNVLNLIVSGTANAAPTVTLASSSNSIANGGTASLTATAADSDGSISKVDFYDGATLLASDTTAPYTYAFSSSTGGVHALRAIAFDNMGASTTSSIVNVTVSTTTNAAPTVSMSAASSAVVAGGSVAISATAADSDGTISKVEFYDGATLVNNDTTAPYGFNFSSTTVGAHTLTARAYDNMGAITTSAPVTVTITAVPGADLPRITLAASSSLVAPGATITLTGTATATVTGVTVAMVSFYMDGVKLADDTLTPYTYVLTVPAGTHTIYATVTDSVGKTNQTLTQTVVGQSAPAVVTTDPDVWRLLNQATFGASQAEAARVNALGIAGWIDDQFTKPVSGYPDTKYNKIQLGTSVDCNSNMPSGAAYPANAPEAMCARDHLSLAMVQRDFFTNAVYAPDQLRQRVAWALSQILVTSGTEQDLSYAHVMSRFQNLMFEEAFGNYEDLLRKITYNPAMGNYLDMVNNDRPAGARVPNENYAREIMQLFSIGLIELNANGTPLLDAGGQPIPTYGQAEIAEFARVFTGYTYASAANPAGPAAAKTGTRYYGAPMVPYTTTATLGHDTLAKTLLNGTVLPPGQSAQQDIDAAVLNVFMHANTPPFVSKQLIQRLVTGNPSNAYVARIAAVFENNGLNVRGDLRSVVRAILLDPEARGGVKTAADFGTLKEPVLVVTGLLRSLTGLTDGAQLATQTANLGQNPYFAPTVFNYFPPDATIPGTAILGPEFAIHTTNSAVGRANLIYRMVYQGFAADPNIIGSGGTRLFLDQFDALATNPAALVSQVNKVLAGGQFPVALEPTIVTAVNAITLSATPTAAEKLNRIRQAVYLMASSYDYQVQR